MQKKKKHFFWSALSNDPSREITKKDRIISQWGKGKNHKGRAGAGKEGVFSCMESTDPNGH